MLVRRTETAPQCRTWPAYSTRPLPPIPIPLLAPDPDVHLDLQPLVAAVYERSRYWLDISYAKAIQPALNEEEQAHLANLPAP
jgi:hypothetical protein